ncbi:MAG: YceI family protein [Terriglobales bacterium]
MHYAAEPAITPEGTTLHYSIKTNGSAFTARAFAAGMLSAFAHSPTIELPDFEGEILLNPDALEQSSLRMIIHAASLNDTDDISAKDHDEINRRMHDEVLEVDSFPDIVYECSSVIASKTGEGQYWVALAGDLTMHGVKRGQPVSTRVSINGDTLRASGDFSVRLSDYEIQPVTAAGGTVKLKDEIKLSFAILARKQP